MSDDKQHFILVLVNVVTKESAGVEFCKDEDDLNFKRKMFLNDFGPDYVALQYPDGLWFITQALANEVKS